MHPWVLIGSLGSLLGPGDLDWLVFEGVSLFDSLFEEEVKRLKHHIVIYL